MRSLRAAGLLLLAPLLALACSTVAPAAAPPGPSGGGDLVLDVPLLEERALLLLMVDRQLFEPMVVDRLVVSPDARLREELATALGRVGDPRGRTWLAQLLADSAVEVRRAAAFALGLLDYGGDPAAGGEISAERREAARGLLVAVADPDRETGLLAVEALGKVGVSVVDVLGALTRSELTEDERWARLLPPLFRFDEPATVAVAQGALGLQTDPELRRRAVYALARNPRPEALADLRELLADADPRVQAWAARALGIVGDGSDVERMEVLLGGATGGALDRATNGAADGAEDGRRDGGQGGAPGGAPSGAPDGAVSDSASAGEGTAAAVIQALRAGAVLAAAATAAAEGEEDQGGSGASAAPAVPPAVVDAWQRHLLRLVSDPRPHVRLEALDTAGAWLPKGGDGVGGGGVGGSEGGVGGELAASLAARAADPEAPAGERAAALLALARSGDPRAAGLAAAFAEAPESPAAVPTPAATSAATSTPAPAPARAPASAPARDPRLLAAAAQAAASLAGEPGGEAMAALLERLGADDQPAVRTAALGAALAAADEEAGAALAAAVLARDPDPGVRGTAFGWLAEHPVMPYVELTRAAQATLAAGNVEASLAAVDALAARAEAAAAERGGVVTVLEKLAANREWLVRRRAAAALAELGRPAPPVAPPVNRPPEHYQRVLQRTATAREVEMATDAGTLRLRLDCPRAPLTCLSFLNLAEQGFFDGLVFHRVVPDFVVQAGDPRGDGLGGPGYAIRDEIGRLRYERGTLGMALAGPDTGGSQFFLTLSPQPHLDGGYTAFGRVVGGDEVLDEIGRGTRILSVRPVAAARTGRMPAGGMPGGGMRTGGERAGGTLVGGTLVGGTLAGGTRAGAAPGGRGGLR